MTVCIAAIATDSLGEQAIVTASDRMLSTAEMSADAVAFKSHFIANGWGLMYAAEDTSHITPIWEITRADLHEKRFHVHCPEVAATIARAYQRQIHIEAYDRVLSRYGLTMKEFLENGSKLFPSSQYEEMHRDIKSIRLGCDFIGYGFDDRAHLFRVTEPGKVIYEDEVGFAAIGSGWYSAISTLFFHSVNGLMEVGEVLYHVLEAKFMAESAPGVGADTHAQILEYDGNVVTIFEESVDEVRRLWGRSGAPRVPRTASRVMDRVIANCKHTSKAIDVGVAADAERHKKRMEALSRELKILEDEPSTSPEPSTKPTVPSSTE